MVEIRNDARKIVLLKAAYDLLKKISNGPNEDVLGETTFYDGADCDGYCLMEDIWAELDFTP